MKLGYSPTTAAVLELDEAFRLADELNLDFVELAWELSEIAPQFQDVSIIRELCRTTGIGTTMHLPFVDLNLASLIPEARRVSVERMQRALEYGAAIGASCGVLHTGRNPYYHPLATSYARTALRESLTALADTPMPIAIENLALSREDLIRGPDELYELTLEAGFDNCFDFGHALVETSHPWNDETSPTALTERYLETLGENVIHLHVHNNDGSADQHLATDQGSIAYRNYADYLRSFGGTVCLEIGGSAEEVRRSVEHMRSVLETEQPAALRH